ncbi:Outer-membrane lipoprotein carrier protein precursor [Marinomonas gallaica]|uniref:Outer-membrane lipoprotein carrier protein n=1 Tax=Marinomonas gallaica TaxID=1806667 RepID=A0A1C3JQW1_9GAMM|nr:outer membrane lipoprotein chaperone LolA [Marinomonas gallaica]SBT17506.1 Outer-membrane lipoprotein carrier protein precursor [Marinomonas gallaica]SBT19698.1 Outer-membrane lipoprotein carrier protein precursor [Marinomonas gallaica]
MSRFICALGMFLAVNAWADTSVDSLTQLLEENRNVEGEFRQVTYNEQGEQVQHSEGVFLLAAPNRFVWDTISPFPQRIISDGKWVTIWDVDLEQATRKPFAGTVGNSPAALLGDSAANVLSHYAVESVGKDSYKLAPNDQEDLFDSLTLSFNDKAISAMSIKDVLGQTTVIEFSNIEAHEGVSEQNFNVDLPESVDVIIEQ